MSAPLIECHVNEIRTLSSDVFWIEMSATNGSLPEYQAGQYLMLELADGSMCPFSIASSPKQDVLELHIRRIAGHGVADAILKQLEAARKAGSTVRVQMPMGECILPDSTRPAVFIAGGTGFSPFHSMIKTALLTQDSRSLTLYWGAQKEEDLYLASEPESWAKDHANVNYVPVISGVDNNWKGRKGFVHHAFLLDCEDLSGKDIFIGGSEMMVMSVYEDLLKRNVKPEFIHADILDIKRQMGLLD